MIYVNLPWGIHFPPSLCLRLAEEHLTNGRWSVRGFSLPFCGQEMMTANWMMAISCRNSQAFRLIPFINVAVKNNKCIFIYFSYRQRSLCFQALFFFFAVVAS